MLQIIPIRIRNQHLKSKNTQYTLLIINDPNQIKSIIAIPVTEKNCIFFKALVKQFVH